MQVEEVCARHSDLSDQLATGRKLRVLTIVDIFSRYAPAVDPRFSYRAEDVVATLDRVGPTKGKNFEETTAFLDSLERHLPDRR